MTKSQDYRQGQSVTAVINLDSSGKKISMSALAEANLGSKCGGAMRSARGSSRNSLGQIA